MTIVNVQKIGEVEGRNGPQWELQVQWPWSVGQNTDRVWLDQSAFQKPALGSQAVEVMRRGVKKNKDGVLYDGNREWMWNWEIRGFGIDAPLPSNPNAGQSSTPDPPAQTQQSQPQRRETASEGPPANRDDEGRSEEEAKRRAPPVKDDRQVSIEKGMAFNAAYTLIASLGVENCPLEGWPRSIRQLRDQMYHDVIQVPVAPPHYCYRHEAERKQSPKTKAWGHMVGDDPCIEDEHQPPQDKPAFKADGSAIDQPQMPGTPEKQAPEAGQH